MNCGISLFRRPLVSPILLCLGIFASLRGSLSAQESLNWSVTTIAGQAGVAAADDGAGAAAHFNSPRGIAIDNSGNVYVADTFNHTIRKITAAGQVSTLAGSPGNYGYADGNGNTALFNQPIGLAVDANGIIYVADSFNNAIRKITPDGTVSTLAGTPTVGSADGTGSLATFNQPVGVAVDSAGTIYVADSGNSALREITAGGVVTTPAFAAGSPQFNHLYGVAVDAGGTVYIADTFNNVVLTASPGGIVTKLAGSQTGASGSVDGFGSSAQFFGPSAIAVNSAGSVYVTEVGNHDVRSIATNFVATIAGNSFASGSADGAGNLANFNAPQGIAVAPDGSLYVCDTLNSTIRKLVRTQVTAPPDTSAPTDPSARFVNISTRSYVGTGANVLIGGFIIGGDAPKKVLIRASGPALIPQGISADTALADPVLQLYQGTAVIASNDNWSEEPLNAAAVLQANQLTSTTWTVGAKDSALVQTLSPGGYTAMVTGKNGGTGIALIEIFELDSNGGTKLVNISTRSLVRTGAGVQIAGFIISGTSSKKVLIRAGGPFLAQLGLDSKAVLSDPVIQLYSGPNIIATNDDWGTDGYNVQQAFQASQATPYSNGSKDAAIVMTLPPGGYTAIISGKNNTEGIALIEVDEVPY